MLPEHWLSCLPIVAIDVAMIAITVAGVWHALGRDEARPEQDED